MPDRYKALWVSHSSISDFQKCPRSYYLKNVYKDPETNKKVKIINGSLTLGTVVHNVLESLSIIPSDSRFAVPLMKQFDKEWEKYSGKRGGFATDSEEREFKKRGEDMIRRVTEHPGPLNELAVKINMELPQFWLSEEDEIILCGKVDWLEYLPDDDSVNIIDFKTSQSKDEEKGSLQLPIYHLLVDRCQKRMVGKASYWYIDLDDEPTEKELPDLDKSEKDVLVVAKKIKISRQLDNLDCPNGEDGCFACRGMERVIKGEAEYVGKDEYGAGVYFLPREEEEEDREGTLL